MEKKCDKYEALFVFGTDEEFQQHIIECPDCKEENEKMQKVSLAVKEVKPYLLKKIPNNNLLLKAVASVFIVFVVGFAMHGLFYENDYNLSKIASLDDKSVIDQMGLPTDDYGLLLVH